jgi:5'-deoxynucleotidase YfbR-like HD superfamily hydrolase
MPITNGKSWIRSRSGKPFFPLNPDPENIDIYDIAHALAHQCRYSGHTKYFYSVAQHSVHVSSVLATKYFYNSDIARAGLMHDASEAYLQDMPSPIKELMPQYKAAENVLQSTIERKFGLDFGMEQYMSIHEKVKEADMIMLATEARDLMDDPKDWEILKGVQRCDWIISPWSPEYARDRFIERFNSLGMYAR